MDDIKQYERGEKETAKAFKAFRLYRGMGADRTMEKVRIALGRPTGYTRVLEAWSSKYNWVARALAWDDELDKHIAINQTDELIAIHDRIVRQMRMAQGIGIKSLLPFENGGLKPQEALRAIEMGARMELGIMKEKIEREEGLIEKRITEYTDEELDAIIEAEERKLLNDTN